VGEVLGRARPRCGRSPCPKGPAPIGGVPDRRKLMQTLGAKSKAVPRGWALKPPVFYGGWATAASDAWSHAILV